MALIRWEPVRELNTLQNEVNRLFNTFFDPQTTISAGVGNGGTLPARRWIPAMDLVERDDAYVLRADLPGLTEEDVHIELEDSVLTVSGRRSLEQERKGEGYYRVERAFGEFSRSLTLPEGINPEAIRANFENGVLEVHIPKPEERKPHRVEIAVGGQQRAVEASAQDTPAAE